MSHKFNLNIFTLVSIVLVASITIILCGYTYLHNQEFVLDDGIYTKYNNFCDNYSVNIVTVNKLSNDVSVYEKIIGSNNIIRIFSENKLEKGYAYYVNRNGKGTYWLDLDYNSEHYKERTDDFNYDIFNNTAFTSKYTLESLGIKPESRWSYIGDFNRIAYYILYSDNLGEITIDVNKDTKDILKITVDDVKERMTILLSEDAIIPVPTDLDNYKEVDTDTFATHLDIIKQNGLYPNGVYTMNNVNTFSIEATVQQ